MIVANDTLNTMFDERQAGQAVDEPERPVDREQRDDQHLGRDDERREDEQEESGATRRPEARQRERRRDRERERAGDRQRRDVGGVEQRLAEVRPVPRLAEVADRRRDRQGERPAVQIGRGLERVRERPDHGVDPDQREAHQDDGSTSGSAGEPVTR